MMKCTAMQCNYPHNAILTSDTGSGAGLGMPVLTSPRPGHGLAI